MLSEMEESKKKQKAESFVKDATVSTKDCFNAFGIEEYANTSKHQAQIFCQCVRQRYNFALANNITQCCMPYGEAYFGLQRELQQNMSHLPFWKKNQLSYEKRQTEVQPKFQQFERCVQDCLRYDKDCSIMVTVNFILLTMSISLAVATLFKFS
ncbi:uncharacterized protein LOC142342242 isoform X2 [Convolutriloba macropyga]